MKLSEILQSMGLSYSSRPLTPEEQADCQASSYNSEAGSLNKYDGINCETCKNKGTVAYAKGTECVTRLCDCMKKRSLFRQMKQSGLSEDMISRFTFANFETTEKWQKDIKELSQRYAQEGARDGMWWYAGGQVGSGKTHLSTAICRRLLLQCGKDVQYILWREEAARLKNPIYTEYEYAERESRKKLLKTVEVLYIDDFFKTGKTALGSRAIPSAAEIALAFELINARYYRKDLLTLFSSELTCDDLMSIDEGLASRIISRAEKYAVNIKFDKGKNYRLKKEAYDDE